MRVVRLALQGAGEGEAACGPVTNRIGIGAAAFAHALGTPGEALDAHLDALPTQTPYAATIDRVRNAKTEAELLHAAQKLDDWRKEVKA